jgi:signal transduction histidine kinase
MREDDPMTAPRHDRVSTRLWRGASWRGWLWRGLPVAVTALLGVGHLVGFALIDAQPGADPVAIMHGWLPGLLVIVQAALLAVRHRVPVVMLIGVAALDATALVLSNGELGTASLAVMIGVYSFTRDRRAPRYAALTVAVAVASSVVAFLAGQSSDEIPSAWALPFVALRNAIAFGAPAAIAEIVTGRARLVEALRDRADAAERDRERRAVEAVRSERALMARELHDVAAHHLSGIIVSAQAADALVRSDPDGASEYLATVKREAQTTLNNLRQTVGLLRTDDSGELAPVPTIDELPALVDAASATGAPVAFEVSGEPVEFGPLAGTAVYRMVQESLANAALHAAGGQREVRLAYDGGGLTVTVRNEPGRELAGPSGANRDGYGLLGMAERADLIGATLRTGPVAGGGWSNELVIPADGSRS